MADNTSIDPQSPPASFIVPLWASVFGLLKYVSLFSILRAMIPWLRQERRAHAVVEIWVIGHVILALATAAICRATHDSPLLAVLLIYGSLRVLEIVVTQANILLFDEWRARRSGINYELRGYRRIVLLLLHNFVEVVFWFMSAIIYLDTTSHLEVEASSLTTFFRQSLLSMVSFSSGSIRAIDFYGSLVLSIQSLVGIFMTVLILARFISLIPAPSTQEPTEKRKSP